MAGLMGQGFPNYVLASRMWGAVATLPTSPEATGKPRRAFVDSSLTLDEVAQWLIQVLEFRRVPQHARPFATHPVIELAAISRAKDQSGKRFGLSFRIVPSQV
jgi:hypothetical protein